MKITLKIAFVCVLALSVSLLLAAAKGDAKKGKDLFATRCSQCHGEKGEGKPAIAKMFNVTLKPLAGTDAQGKTDDQLTKIILNGNGKMKPVKLSETEAADTMAFLRALAAEKK